MAEGWDAAPRALAVIKVIGKTPPTISPRLVKKLTNLQSELAIIRKDEPRIIPKLTRRLRAKYTYHTNAIEGNTLTLSETRAFIETGMTISGKPLRDFTEAKNIPEALNMVIDIAQAGKPLRLSDLLDLHRIVVKDTDEADPGYFRKGLVTIGDSKYVPPPAYELGRLVDEIIACINKNPEKLNPYQLAFKAHLWLASIHPFEDGNGRVARLLAAIIQLKHHTPSIIIKAEHKKRYWSVLRKTQDKVTLKPYYDFMAEEYIATLIDYITAARQAGPEDDLVPLAQAAKKYKLDAEYLGLLGRTGVINATKHGGRWMVRIKDFHDYMSHGRTPQRKPKRKRSVAA
jgi:Fic family protein